MQLIAISHVGSPLATPALPHACRPTFPSPLSLSYRSLGTPPKLTFPFLAIFPPAVLFTAHLQAASHPRSQHDPPKQLASLILAVRLSYFPLPNTPRTARHPRRHEVPGPFLALFSSNSPTALHPRFLSRFFSNSYRARVP
ncbi:hypothetical protein DICSQDRAFT_170091 [Dichomitus squalens LYAD-421 SS1]|uniref:Uncharacterized protein n=1 Tax=Dichomitus squalens (strain LYAD-421) TaxID=732165 RepID=R7T047_DICSQ|nr:uncharacterized protein DICSQDRAFT_170091 [Dichomitus squalens LYAD-421 SS1]EJF61676.1 hypothetical protein DICSQDRAFT_170091 [Dichomitus squalens LYAD-421 SS1]